MTGWRVFGSLMMFVALLAVSGSFMPAGAQDKDKKPEKTDKTEKDTKKETPKETPKKETPKEAPKETGGDITLKFKAFDSGAPVLYQTQTTKTNQTMKVMNQEVIQKQEQTFFISWTPKTDKGDLVVVQKIIGVKLAIDIGGNKISYDSTNEEQQKQSNPMTDFFNALKTLELTFTIDPQKLTITKIEGRDALIKKLSESTPPMKALLENILSDDAIKQMAQPTWGAVPKTAVKKDSTWTEETKLNLGAIGSYDTVFTYKFIGADEKKNGLDKISVTPKLTYQAPKDKAAASLPFTIKDKSTLTTESADGTVWFDQKKGRIVDSTITMKLKGDLIIDVGGTETTVQMVQEQTSTATFSETSPLPAAKK
jgi:hypothetical protein